MMPGLAHGSSMQLSAWLQGQLTADELKNDLVDTLTNCRAVVACTVYKMSKEDHSTHSALSEDDVRYGILIYVPMSALLKIHFCFAMVQKIARGGRRICRTRSLGGGLQGFASGGRRGLHLAGEIIFQHHPHCPNSQPIASSFGRAFDLVAKYQRRLLKSEFWCKYRNYIDKQTEQLLDKDKTMWSLNIKFLVSH